MSCADAILVTVEIKKRPLANIMITGAAIALAAGVDPDRIAAFLASRAFKIKMGRP